MRFDNTFRDTFKNKQLHIILSGCIQIWHFYRTWSRGSLFPGVRVNWTNM